MVAISWYRKVQNMFDLLPRVKKKNNDRMKKTFWKNLEMIPVHDNPNWVHLWIFSKTIQNRKQ